MPRRQYGLGWLAGGYSHQRNGWLAGFSWPMTDISTIMLSIVLNDMTSIGGWPVNDYPVNDLCNDIMPILWYYRLFISIIG